MFVVEQRCTDPPARITSPCTIHGESWFPSSSSPSSSSCLAFFTALRSGSSLTRCQRTRKSPDQTPRLGIIDERTVHPSLHRVTTDRLAAVLLVPLDLDHKNDGAPVLAEHHLARRKRVYHALCPHRWLIFLLVVVVSGGAIGTTTTSQLGVRHMGLAFVDGLRPKPYQPVLALSQRLHQRAVTAGGMGLPVAHRRTRGTVVVSTAAGGNIWHGVHGEAQHHRDSDRLGPVAGHEV